MLRDKSLQSQAASEVEKSYSLAADFFFSLSKPTALMILDIVRKKETSPRNVSKELGIKLKTVLAELREMEREGLFVSSRSSQTVFYRLADPRILEALDRILEFPLRKMKQDGAPIRVSPEPRQKSNKHPKADSVKQAIRDTLK